MSQLYVICFDVADKKRLRHVAIQMENFGQRVQYSVFECHLDEGELEELKARLEAIINKKEDHVRYYGICNKDKSKILIDGSGSITRDNDYYMG
ncbi:MAG: CRISPR-associated endonuclease Cas2 [Cocleimonas sp.]